MCSHVFVSSWTFSRTAFPVKATETSPLSSASRHWVLRPVWWLHHQILSAHVCFNQSLRKILLDNHQQHDSLLLIHLMRVTVINVWQTFSCLDMWLKKQEKTHYCNFPAKGKGLFAFTNVSTFYKYCMSFYVPPSTWCCCNPPIKKTPGKFSESHEWVSIFGFLITNEV